MEKLFRDIINELYRLNDLFGKRALSATDIKAEEENYIRFINMQEKLLKLMPKLQQSSLNNKSEYTQNLLELYAIIGNLHECCDDLHDSFRKVMRQVYLQLGIGDEKQQEHEM